MINRVKINKILKFNKSLSKNYNFDIENNFFKNINHQRASKIFFQLECFKRILNVKGCICEFGVFKGNSLNRLIIFRDFYSRSKKIYAFDVFKLIKVKKNSLDAKQYNQFLFDSKKFQPTYKDIKKNLISKNFFFNLKLVKGDVIKTLNKQGIKKISFVILDLDLYEPTIFVLNNIWDKMSKNGIIFLDNYKVFKGETKAVDEFIKENNIKVTKEKFYRDFYFLKK